MNMLFIKLFTVITLAIIATLIWTATTQLPLFPNNAQQGTQQTKQSWNAHDAIQYRVK